MKKNIMKRWVKALRSGEYRKGIGQLKKDDKYCCLGVLCDLRGKRFIGTNGGVSKAVMEWSGLKSSEGEFSKKPSLIHLNDFDLKPFSEIADIIEKNWKDL